VPVEQHRDNLNKEQLITLCSAAALLPEKYVCEMLGADQGWAAESAQVVEMHTQWFA
jgi:hypothetical protein